MRIERGKKISERYARQGVVDLPEMPPYKNNGWSVRFQIPFTQASSKNHIYTLAKGGDHLYKRAETRKFQDDLTQTIRANLEDIKVFHNKIWISLFVQKPHHRGDAINVIDVIADAVKKAIGVDDRWFCIQGIDWEIAKNDPQIFISLHQPDAFDALVCSHCGRVLSLDHFTKKKDGPMGKSRVCRDCSSKERRINPALSSAPTDSG